MSNPLPFYFETEQYRYFRYSDDVCIVDDKVLAKSDPRRSYDTISLQQFKDSFNKLPEADKAKWLRWTLPENTYRKWSK